MGTTLRTGVEHTFVNDWLPVCKESHSPLHIGDTLFVGLTPTNIIGLDDNTIRTRDLLTDHFLSVPTSGQFYRDTDGLMSAHRPSVRSRNSPTFFTYDVLGG